MSSATKRVLFGVLITCGVVMLLPVLGWAAPPPESSDPGFFAQWSQRVRDFFSSNVINLAWRGLLALLLFLAGWLVAKLIAYVIFRLLCRTNLAARVADKLGAGRLMEGEDAKEEKNSQHAVGRK